MNTFVKELYFEAIYKLQKQYVRWKLNLMFQPKKLPVSPACTTSLAITLFTAVLKEGSCKD